MLHKEIPFLRIGLPFCAGIISGLYFKPDYIFLSVSFIAIISGFAVSLIFNKNQTNIVFGLVLTSTLFIFGLIMYTFEKTSNSTLESKKTLFACSLTDFPAEKEKTYMLNVRLHGKVTGDSIKSVKGSMIIYCKKDSYLASLKAGDLLMINCTPAEITRRGNPYEFDYRFYMENQGIRYYAFINKNDLLSQKSPEHRKLVHKALIIREKIIGMYRARGITGERLALVAAITLGQKNMLDQEQKQYFIKAGIMHIMAVSGLHAVILSLFIFNLLFFLKRRYNILRVLITVVLLWSFAFITGLTPSVMRATLMFSCLQAGKIMKREVNGINSVLASAFILILLKPSVIFDAGFLLSYSAVIFIISFYRDFYLKLHFNNRIIDLIWQSVVVTIIAQAGTVPLTIMLFNRFPTYFILTNVIIVPVSNLLIVLGCLVPMFFPVQFLSKFFAVLLGNLTGLTEFMTAKASTLPYSTIENIGMTTISCILLSGTIYISVWYLLKRRSFSLLYPLLFILMWATAGTLQEFSTRKTNELIVYNIPGASAIGIRTGNILHLYSDTSITATEVIRHCAAQRLKVKTNILNNRFRSLNAAGKKILIIDSPDKNILEIFSPDIIILTGIKPTLENLSDFKNLPEIWIIPSEASLGFRFPKQINTAATDTLHFVRKSGAYVMKL